MGSEGEEASSSTPKLPLFSMHCSSPEPWSGMLTPLHTSASVPFRWEEEPGKPLSYSTALITTTTTPNPTKNFCLELPPRLQLQDHHHGSSSRMTKTPSPTTVLDGPYLGGGIGIRSSSSSFRFMGRRHHHIHGAGSFGCRYDNESPERVQFGGSKYKGRGFFFGSWRISKPATGQSSSSEEPAGEGSFVFATSSSSLDYLADFGGGGDDNNNNAKRGKKISRSSLRRNGSLSSSVSRVRTHLWATIYQGLKQVVPWKGRKSKKEGLLV
ncbi:uncharacterized protein At4g00950-like [Diospyros lotus]|uniref:uncharacterized protein At4g00950-like n=1 Tax=Diospyros lotus TaxID=55363 RepID=UPI00224EF2AA|nr:uncharacterized protein At4g00950-like [Diospyros lotus]